MMLVLRRLRRYWRYLAVVALVVVLTPVLVSLARPKQAARILPVDQSALIQPLAPDCLPNKIPGVSDPLKQLSFQLTGRVEFEGAEYRLYQVSRQQSSNDVSFPHLVQVKEGWCQAIATNAMGDDNLYLHRVVSLPIARQLSLAQLQSTITRSGGLKAFQTQLNTRFQQLPAGETVVIPEEEAWAFQQVGIALPAALKVAPAGNSFGS